MAQDYHGRCAAGEFAALDDPRLPERFQNYIVDKNKIGEGPISYCYRAKRIDGGMPVRLKVLRKRVCELPQVGELVQRLAKASTQFAGENVLRLNGSGMHDGILLLEFEYFESVSLRAVIDADAPFHPDLVALIAVQVAAGLNQIHGVRPSPGMGNLIPLHRNLKPENVLISQEGKIKITDIDAVQVADFCDAARLALPHPTEVYQSPEQLLRGGYADRRSDIYSLGLMMLEMATGRFLYEGDNVFKVRQNVRENKRSETASMYPPIHEAHRRKLTRNLAQIIDNMIAYDPERRTQTLIEVESQLNRYLEGSQYIDSCRPVADFLRVRSFHPERVRSRSLLDRLFGR